MKALVHTAPFKFEYKDVPMPAVGSEEVLVRVKAVGICGSDLHGYTGETGRRVPPCIMGHEAAGVVEAVGQEARGVAVGDRITFDSTVYCNQCPPCRRGRINLCEHRRVLGSSHPTWRRDGGMAEFVVVPWWITYKVPDALSFEEAALVETAAVGLHAARITPIDLNDTVAVIGAGPIGLFAIQAAKVRGAGRVVALDMCEERLAFARDLGADVLINTAQGDVGDALQKTIGHPDVDVVLEAVGLAATMAMAWKLTRKGGQLTLIGNIAPVPFPLPEVIVRELTIRGSLASAGEFRACLDLMAQGRIVTKPLISKIMPLSEGQLAFETLHRGDPRLLKVLLRP
jgi:threonine dehydrogenase-like Zn-dependent dehydrogenase